MDNNKPLVSIILPVRNQKRFLPECLKSLRAQTYRNIEIIAVNDKSSDNSLKILKQFKKKCKRIRIIKNKKQYGLAVCMNRAIRRAKGAYIAFMNANDLSQKDRIKKQVNFLTKHPKVVVIGTNSILIDKKSKINGRLKSKEEHNEIAKDLLSGQSVQFYTAMVNTLLLPKDMLKFKENTYPLIFVEQLVKFMPYGLFANLKNYLYYQRIENKSRLEKIKQYPSLVRLFFRSILEYDYRPSFWSIFLPPKTLIRH